MKFITMHTMLVFNLNSLILRYISRRKWI